MNSVAVKKQPESATTNIIVDSKQRSWWNSLSEEQRNFIATLSIVLGVSVVALIAFYFIRRQIRIVRSNKTQTKSFGADKHATWAKQFMQAFANDVWWGMGTDESLIRQLMLAIPSQEDFDKVAVKYSLLTKGGNLITDMSDELSSTEYQEMLAIKSSKPKKAKDAKAGARIYDPKGWAKRVHAAVNYYWGFMPGTDEEAIVAVFHEFPNQKAFYATAYEYKKFYGTSIWTDLDGDLDYSLDWRALLKKKPKK